MYFLFAGGSDKMPLQVVRNETVVIASTRRLLGVHWDRSQEEGCSNLIILWNVTPCGLAERLHRSLLPSSCTLMVAESVSQTLIPLCETTQRHTPEGCDLHETVRSHKMPEVHFHCARHL
jgi:hypothetical protein